MNDITRHLRVLVGPAAAKHIREEGLSPEHIGAVFGASGAAKWLGICGLDRAIFGTWLSTVQREILLYGTSVGAFKLAAACRQDPAAALSALADAYIAQSYPDGAGADAIDRETGRILDTIFAGGGAAEILENPKLRYSCGVARCSGWMASPNKSLQYLGAGKAMLANVLGRNAHRRQMQRVVFADVRSQFPILARDAYGSEVRSLTAENLPLAVKASGSIPIMMHAQTAIPGAPAGVYVDGGVVDYHPVPGWFWDSKDIVLYPHFYPWLKAGWFDKYYRRQAEAALLDNVVLLAPSDEHLASLDLGRIPDRRDFLEMKDDDAERVRLWRDATDKSERLGEAFLSLVSDNRLADHMEILV